MSLANRLRDAVAGSLGVEVTGATVVRGGDVASAYRMTLADGRVVFAKTHPDPPTGFFTTEAAGLSWLRRPGVVAVPEVLAVSDGGGAGGGSGGGGEEGQPAFLALAWIDEGHPTSTTEVDLGRALAALHRSGTPCFGREDRRTTGSRGLPNEPRPTWAEFYATQRLLPLAALARATRSLPEAVIGRLEALATGDTLASLPGADEPAARLHGDLWGGNRLIGADGVSWLIDPAAHGGHREFDLAMMRLFGGFGPDCFEAYADAYPLAPGWSERVSLHQIAPLVVHAVKFGGSYVAAATEAIDRWSSERP